MTDPYKPKIVALTIGQNIRSARRRAGLTQEDLGQLTDLHRTEIGVLERGLRVPRTDTLFKIAVGVGLKDPGPLFEGLTWTPAIGRPEGSWSVVKPPNPGIDDHESAGQIKN